MAEDDLGLPTLASLLEHLLELKGKRQELRKQWTSSLAVNRPWTIYIKKQPPTLTENLQQEIDNLYLLIADCKTAILEFIPNIFQPIPVSAYGCLYFISKGPKVGGKLPQLIIRQQE